MDSKETREFMKIITGAYPSFEPTQDRVEIWSRLMDDIDYDVAVKRLYKHIAVSKYAPSISEILTKSESEKYPPNF